MVGCRTSFRFAVMSRDDVTAVADGAALPVQQKDNTAVHNVNFGMGHNSVAKLR